MTAPLVDRIGFSVIKIHQADDTSDQDSALELEGKYKKTYLIQRFFPSSLGGLTASKPSQSTVCAAWQNGILRYNCADSLDRTNLASFFITVKVLLQQCSELKIDVRAQQQSLSESPSDESDAALPEGWESKRDPVTGKMYYINHKKKTTTWQKPGQSQRRQSASVRGADNHQLAETVDDMRYNIAPPLLDAMGSLFQGSGDIQAACYTGTKTLHSSMINIFSNEHDKQRTGANAARYACNCYSVSQHHTCKMWMMPM